MTNPKRLKVGDLRGPQATSLKARFGGRESNGDKPKFEWAIANPNLIAEAVAKTVRGGDALMFGRTLDGGAGVVTVLAGDERQRFYPADSRSADAALMQISYAYSTPEEKHDFPAEFVPMGKI